MASAEINYAVVGEKCAFTQGLSGAARAEFLAAGRRREFPNGTFLFLQDEPADLFYILVAGKVRLSQLTPEGHQVIVHHVTPGEGIGVIVVLSHMPYPVSAETLEDCVLLSWDGEITKQLMLQHPQLALNGLSMIAQHFVQISDRYRELATERVERRLAHALLRLVRQVGTKTEQGVLIDIPLSRQDLGEMSGTTLHTASRILSEWDRQGWIAAGRTRIELLQPHKIVAIAEDLPIDLSPTQGLQ